MEKDSVKFFEKQLERVNYWLSFAEAKNAALVVFNTAILALLVEIFTSDSIHKNCSLEFWGIITAVLSCVSLVFTLGSFLPYLKNSEESPDNKIISLKSANLLFYRDIYNCGNAELYRKYISQQYHLEILPEQSSIIDDYAEEIFINSKITVRKYKIFKYAVIVNVIMLLPLIIVIGIVGYI